jgi:hypothetical protein
LKIESERTALVDNATFLQSSALQNSALQSSAWQVRRSDLV